MIRMIDWTLKERLEDRRSGGRNPTVQDTLFIVQAWLRELSKQAEKDGHGIASDVLEKAAIHLKQGAV